MNFYLTIAGGKDQMASIYKYKEEKGNYEEYKREKYEEKVKGVEISEEKDVMVVYFESRTMVETKINENNKDLSQK